MQNKTDSDEHFDTQVVDEFDAELKLVREEINELKEHVKLELGDLKNTVKYSSGSRPQSKASNHLKVRQEEDRAVKESEIKQF